MASGGGRGPGCATGTGAVSPKAVSRSAPQANVNTTDKSRAPERARAILGEDLGRVALSGAGASSVVVTQLLRQSNRGDQIVTQPLPGRDMTKPRVCISAG